jgi:hypothetical protein
VDEEGSTSPPPHAAELSKARATLNANIAACFVKLVRERRCAVRGALLTARAGRAITRKLSAHAAKVSLLRSLPPCITAQVYLALKDDPSYTKALTRRAAANEALNTWSSLSAAQEGMYIGALHPTMPLDSDLNCPLDYEKLLTLVPAAETGKIRATLNKVKPRAEAAQRQEMGDSRAWVTACSVRLLEERGPAPAHSPHRTGNFGLSTDNFKFEPNGQGGYSVNFSR